MYKDSGAHLIDIHFQVVSQPGEDPGKVFEGVMDAVQKVCGENAGVCTIDHDPEHRPEPMTFIPLFVLDRTTERK